jgi:hypothetical protein
MKLENSVIVWNVTDWNALLSLEAINTVSYVEPVPYLISVLFRLRHRQQHNIDRRTQRTQNVQTMFLVDYRHDSFCMYSEY